MSNPSMAKSKFSETKTLFSLLELLPKRQARAIILALAEGAVMAIKARQITVEEGEELVFNTDTYFLAKDSLKDSKLASIVSAGIQLEDSLEILGDSALTEACDNLIKEIRPSLPENPSANRSAKRKHR